MPRQAVTGSHDGAAEDYPQAIADDYPGWAVTCHDDQWATRCPAVTAHTASAATLRAAIEHAITGVEP
jgi:hypothetical protein